MIGVWLPDTIGDRRPQNLPGTWDQYPNWRLPVADAEGRPVTLEELAASPRLHALVDVLRVGLGRDGTGFRGRRRRGSVRGSCPVRHPRARGPFGRSLRLRCGQEERPARRRPGCRYDADDAAHDVPALALTRDDGDDPGKGLSVAETLGLYVLIPLALFAIIAGLVMALDKSKDRAPKVKSGTTSGTGTAVDAKA